MKVFIEFYESGTINKGVSATFIVPNPKKEEAKEFSDYRPISLKSSIYKILVKVLSMRLRGVMDKVIWNSQGAFVKGRQIMDGILIANECVDWRRKSKQPSLVCRIDLEIAYNW